MYRPSATVSNPTTRELLNHFYLARSPVPFESIISSDNDPRFLRVFQVRDFFFPPQVAQSSKLTGVGKILLKVDGQFNFSI